MTRHCSKGIIYAPLYKMSYRPHSYACVEPLRLVATADKLRYYRHKKGLLQREVATYAGINRTTYNAYENGVEMYPLDKLAKIAELLEVDIVDLLDEYNLFLYCGQARQVKALRIQMNLTQAAFAARFGLYTDTVKCWEQGKNV